MSDKAAKPVIDLKPPLKDFYRFRVFMLELYEKVDRPSIVRLDVADAESFSSDSAMLIGCLMSLYKTLRQKNCELALVNCGPWLKEKLRMVCLDKLFSVEPGDEKAREDFWLDFNRRVRSVSEAKKRATVIEAGVQIEHLSRSISLRTWEEHTFPEPMRKTEHHIARLDRIPLAPPARRKPEADTRGEPPGLQRGIKLPEENGGGRT